MKILGLVGKKGSGKNTVADMVKLLHPSAKDMALADPLKWCCMLDVHVPEPDIIEKPPETRKLLQWFGTEVGRTVDANLWIKLLQARMMLVEKHLPDVDLIIITDVRFLNEVQALHDMGATIWKINRPAENTDTHASEIEMDQINPKYYSAVINNIGTLPGLKDNVTNVYHAMEIPNG